MSAADLNWYKSSYSTGSNDNCVEVADDAVTVRVRDTKDHGKGELLASPAAWASFVDGVRTA